jgi:hypothetical protein
MSLLLPDPLDFVMEALAAEGALCERHENEPRADALLPSDVARRLEVPEECRLAVHTEDRGEVACGLGSPLLEQLVTEARGRCPAVSIHIDTDAPRPAHVRALAERFVLRNGITEIAQVTMGSARYALAWVAYAVEADDRREGLVRVITGPDGGEPDEAVQARLDLAWEDAQALRGAEGRGLGHAARWIVTRAERAIRTAVMPLLSEVERRKARDHERIASYFNALIAEARTPRRRMEAAAVEAKVAHLVAERDKKLRDLGERFATRVRASLAAVVCAELPAASISMRLRRRKASREISLRVPAGATSTDRFACEGCGVPTGRPAACDERLHLLCEACAPVAQGRIACPACIGSR